MKRAGLPTTMGSISVDPLMAPAWPQPPKNDTGQQLRRIEQSNFKHGSRRTLHCSTGSQRDASNPRRQTQEQATSQCLPLTAGAPPPRLLAWALSWSGMGWEWYGVRNKYNQT